MHMREPREVAAGDAGRYAGDIVAMTALTIIVFQSAPRPLPDTFGSQPWNIAGANLKGFNVFTIGVALAAFFALLIVLKNTSFGKAVRAIGDDEEVSKVVGIKHDSGHSDSVHSWARCMPRWAAY